MNFINRKTGQVDFIDGWESSCAGYGGRHVTMNSIHDRKMFEEGPETVTVGYRVMSWVGIEGGVDKYFTGYSAASDEFDRLVRIGREQEKAEREKQKVGAA